MRFHATGLVVLGLLLLLAIVGGAWSAVAVARLALVLLGTAALIEVVVNMIRHRDFRVRSRLLGWMGRQGSFASWPRSRDE